MLFLKGLSPNKFIGSFKIIDGLNVDGAEVTDGVDVCNMPLGNLFPHGLLVVQDGKNFELGKPAAQNFKLIRWDSIAIKFKPSLKF